MLLCRMLKCTPSQLDKEDEIKLELFWEISLALDRELEIDAKREMQRAAMKSK